jgi:hypothetical protein
MFTEMQGRGKEMEHSLGQWEPVSQPTVSTLKMEAACSSQMSVSAFETKWYHNLKYYYLKNHCRENIMYESIHVW